jgi:hypothetical protein
MVLETSVLSTFNQLTRLEDRENFINFSRRESLKSYIRKLPVNFISVKFRGWKGMEIPLVYHKLDNFFNNYDMTQSVLYSLLYLPILYKLLNSVASRRRLTLVA